MNGLNIFDVENLAKNVHDQIRRYESSRVKEVAAELLGIKIDCWDRVESVDDNLTSKIEEYPEVQKAVSEFEQKVALAIADSGFTKTQISSMAKNIKLKILHKVFDKLYEELYNSLFEKVKEQVTEELKKDPDWNTLMVAYELKKSNIRKQPG